MSFIYAVVIARTLGVSGKGTVSALILLATASAGLGLFGSREGVAYQLATYGVATFPELLSRCYAHAVAIGVGTALISLAAQSAGVLFLRDVAPLILLVVGLSTGLIVLGHQGQAALIALGDVRGAALAPLIQIGLALLLFIGAGLAGAQSVSLAVLAYVAGIICSQVFCQLRMRPYMRGGLQGAKWSSRDYWSYCMRAFPSSVAQLVALRFDQFAIASTLGATGIGVYGSAANVAEVGMYPAASLSAVILPAAARTRRARRFVIKSLGIAACVGAASTAVLWVIGPIVIREMFGAAFVAGVPILRILLIASFFSGILRVASGLSAGLGRPEVGATANAGAMIVTIVGCLWAIPLFGLAGAAWAAVIAYSVGMTLGVVGSFRTAREC